MTSEEIKAMFKLAKKEAVKLRERATPGELAKLNFEWLDYANPKTCIYGQMTGNCYSDRAKNLIVLCAERIYEKRFTGSNSLTSNVLGGAPTIEARWDYFSPIEMFIYRAPTKSIKSMISFLQGTSNSLDF